MMGTQFPGSMGPNDLLNPNAMMDPHASPGRMGGLHRQHRLSPSASEYNSAGGLPPQPSHALPPRPGQQRRLDYPDSSGGAGYPYNNHGLSQGYHDQQDWYEEDRWRRDPYNNTTGQVAPAANSAGYYPAASQAGTAQQQDYYSDQQAAYDPHGQYYDDQGYGNGHQQQWTPQSRRAYYNDATSASVDADFAKMRQMYDEEY